MKKIAFLPFSITGGVLAGFVAKKTFEQVWGLIDEEEPPDPSVLRSSWAKLLLATAIEGAIFRATRAAVDRGSRKAFMDLTGSWPGKLEPEPE
ncbi:MAG: DUF4235 domain-containing protein [Thermoleophilaceae bacterium]